MNSKILLFEYRNSSISITIEAYFSENGDLHVQGYDIGKTVEEVWGDSDYEYELTVHQSELPKFWSSLNFQGSDPEYLLYQLGQRFTGNTSYSEIMDYLQEHQIPFESFSWS